MQWSVYNDATKRVQYSADPTSTITAEMVMVSGFALLQENAEEITSYQANNLNQYIMLSVDDITDFIPSYDADGNQTRVKTSTGIWTISYDAENRPTDFTSQAADGTITSVHCEYDYMGRRTTKMVTVGNNVTLQQRYIYRGYLQIACIDLTRSHHPALWYITWDPTQPVATRPLAIQKDGTWYTYGWDLTKNICEVYGPNGNIRTAYTYTPYGEVSAEGDVTQPIQWSSEYNDLELGLIYYNYRHYNPVDGRWIGRDGLWNVNLYQYLSNDLYSIDVLGTKKGKIQIDGYSIPVIRYVKPGTLPRDINKDALTKLVLGSEDAAAITQVLIKKKDIHINCKRCGRKYNFDNLKIKASIIVLINEKCYSNYYHDPRYVLPVSLDYYYSYIPTNNLLSCAKEEEVMDAENDHVRDFQKWLSSEKLVQKLESSLSKISVSTYNRCIESSRILVESILKEEYKDADMQTKLNYDYGENKKHKLNNYMPDITDGLIAVINERISKSISEKFNEKIIETLRQNLTR